MVGDEGQLYTIEGVAAAVLIITTVYIVLTSTVLLTPAETHIYDMQLEQLGNDVLAAMDTPSSWNSASGVIPVSSLETYVQMNQSPEFQRNFTSYCNTTTGSRNDDIDFNAHIIYRNMTTSEVRKKFFSSSSGKDGNYNRENAVMVSRWVNIGPPGTNHSDLDNRPQTVLLEVLLWRR
jgi:hypothetical protein